MKINWNKVATTLTGIAIIAFLGGVLDFQNIKAEVKDLKKESEISHRTIVAIGLIVCRFAIETEMKDAKETCKDVLR